MSVLAGAIGGAFGDVFGRPLRGLMVVCALLAAALLATLVWVGLTYLVPLVPWEGWLGAAAETIAAILTVLAGIILLPPVAMILGGVFLDPAAGRVERLRFPADPPGKDLSPPRALGAGLRLAALALPLNLLALPLYLIPVLNLILYWGLNGYLLSREYFSLAALRFCDWNEAQALRRRNRLSVLAAGLAIALVMSVPVLNLITPLFGIALMVRLFKGLAPA